MSLEHIIGSESSSFCPINLYPSKHWKHFLSDKHCIQFFGQTPSSLNSYPIKTLLISI